MRPRLLPCLILALAALPIAGLAAPADRAAPATASPASVPWITGVRFTIATGGPIRGTPLVSRGTLFFGSTDGNLYAVDARSGRSRWRFATGGAVNSAPAADNERVYFASRDATLYALATATGRLAWKHRFGADLGPHNYWDYQLSSPVLAGSAVIVGGGDGSVSSLDARTGRTLWRFDAGARVRSTPAVAAGYVVFGTMSGHVIALRERDGALAWKFATAGAARTFEEDGNDTTSVFASPTIVGERVFAGARDGFLYAIDLRRGTQLWRTTHDGSSWILSTASDSGRLYVGSGSAMIVQAVDLATGAEIWHAATRGAVFSSITVSGDTLLFSDFAGNVEALDRSTGARQWRYAMGGRSLSTPVVSGGIVYCASDAGILYALDAGEAQPRQSGGAPVRIVYTAGMRTAHSFSWFQHGVDAAIAAQLKAAGYTPMDTPELEGFMRNFGPGSPRAVVVMADNRIAPELVASAGGVPLIRQFLESGGKVVLLGPNPLAYVSDPKTDEVTGVDYEIPKRVFEVPYAPLHDVGGYYASLPTAAGRRMGLRTASVGFPALTPDARTTALAVDEFGKASSWLRSYGGPPGTGLLQLQLPRAQLTDTAEAQAAIEYGVTW